MKEIEISAVIITHNEEKNIERCIQSLNGIADEILIVDSFSTDKTIEIAKKYNIKIVQHVWQGYSEQKNYANNEAKFDWILSLDADEALSETLKKSILEIKKNNTSDAYYMNRLTNYCGHWIKYGDWYPDTKMRLWNKKRGLWHGLIHENVLMQANTTSSSLQGDILHYSFYSITEHLLQINRYTELMARENILKNKKSTLPKIIFSPIIKFIKAYIIKLGFLDSYAGFQVAIMSSFATFIKYVRTYELQKKS